MNSIEENEVVSLNNNKSNEESLSVTIDENDSLSGVRINKI